MTVKMLIGDASERLRALSADSVHCVVTSPPYWGLRDYGVEGQIGLEPTPDEWAARLVEVFREVRRVLRPDGVCFVNIGDSYCSGTGCDRLPTTTPGGRVPASWSNRSQGQRVRPVGDIKPKDLIGQPWLLAFALRADGWWLRSEIIWAKPNPMPESVRDRPTKAHEQVFLLTKSGDEATYWTHRDHEGSRTQPPPDYRWQHKETGEEVAVEPADPENWRRVNLWQGHAYFYDAEAVREAALWPNGPNAPDKISSPYGQGFSAGRSNGVPAPSGRNARSVWTIATEPFPEAHFATFPTELARRCILAGTSAKGCCPQCGAPWARVVERGESPTEQTRRQKHLTAVQVSRTGGRINGGTSSTTFGLAADEMPRTTTVGWRPTCTCDAGDPVPCTVLDCFGGSGTTGVVADQLGHDAILIELSPDYAAMAERRIAKARSHRALGVVKPERVLAGQLSWIDALGSAG